MIVFGRPLSDLCSASASSALSATLSSTSFPRFPFLLFIYFALNFFQMFFLLRTNMMEMDMEYDGNRIE